GGPGGWDGPGSTAYGPTQPSRAPRAFPDMARSGGADRPADGGDDDGRRWIQDGQRPAGARRRQRVFEGSLEPAPLRGPRWRRTVSVRRRRVRAAAFRRGR